MRNLAKDTLPVYIGRYEGLEKQQVNGKYTGKVIPKYAEPVLFSPTVTMAQGQSDGDGFGVSLDYDRVMTIDDPNFEVSESDVFWVNKDISDAYDYTVKRIARKGSYTVIAIKQVEVSQ